METKFITKNGKKIPIQHTAFAKKGISPASLTEERRKDPDAFAKARKKGFRDVNGLFSRHPEMISKMTPDERLELANDIRKGTFDDANITQEEQKLRSDIKRIQKLRVDSMVRETGHHPREVWQKEKQAHIDLANLQGNKLREGFAES